MLSPVPILDELNIRRLGVFFGATLPVAFALNYVWEIAQCRLFFIHGTLPPTQLAMLGATAGDVVLTGIAYLGVAAVSRRLMWPLATWSFRTWL